jgi:hypothetical protein
MKVSPEVTTVIKVQAVLTLIKVSMIMPATATHDCICLGHLGRRNTGRSISIFCRTTHGGQDKYSSDQKFKKIAQFLEM